MAGKSDYYPKTPFATPILKAWFGREIPVAMPT
jgi:hypothetical protein